MKAFTKRLNSIRNSMRFSRRCRSRQRGDSGIDKASHAFKFQANEVMTMYAQLLSSVSTGECKAGSPFFNWSMSFSWSQRSLAEKTISSADDWRSLVM